MGTLGIVSILDIDGKKMLFKVVAGMNGHNASKLADWVKGQKGVLTIEGIYQAAKQVSFGSQEDLVVQDAAGSLCYDGDRGPAELGELYRDHEKFCDPRFNPRWAIGISDYFEVVTLMP